jgi:plasmid stabilization system protein ParE
VKKAQVIWADEALNDLESIYEFLTEKSQPSAQRIVEAIFRQIQAIRILP